MSVIVEDNFNRASGALGSPWSYISGPTAYITGPGRLRTNAFTSGPLALYTLPASYPDDYRVQFDAVCLTEDTAGGGGSIGVVLRMADSSNLIHVRHFRQVSAWEVYRIGASSTKLASWSDSFPPGVTRHVDAAVEGTSLTVAIDGVVRLSTSSIDIASGPAGVRFRCGWPASDTEGQHMDNFRVVTLDHVDGGIPQPLLEGYI